MPANNLEKHLSIKCSFWYVIAKYLQYVFAYYRDQLIQFEYAQIAKFMGPTWGPSGADKNLATHEPCYQGVHAR